MCIYVYMILTFFYRELSPITMPFFITHFLIHHSFLDFLYIGFPAIRGNYLSGQQKFLFLFDM
jgi:hypothetical protein